MSAKKVWRKVERGGLDLSFPELLQLAQAFGFELDRVRGSHHILVHPRIPVILNLQPERGRAKRYQTRQLIGIVRDHGLQLDD